MDPTFMDTATVGADISLRCHVYEAIHLIKSHLKGTSLDAFRNSCFGHLLPAGDQDSAHQLQLIYVAMLNMSMEKRNRTVPLFYFNGQPVEFSKIDFYLMTGLHFGEPVKAPTKSQLHATVFNHKEKIQYCEIKQQFLVACDRYSGDDDICLKLGLLLFVYGVIIPRDSGNKYLNIRYMHIVDDVRYCNTYPWGLLAYNYLCNSLFSAYDRMLQMVKRKPNNKPAFDLFGFVLPLQCWLYEVFPTVADKLGERTAGWSGKYPRMIRWNAKGVWHYRKVKELFLDPGLQVRPLEFSDYDRLVLPPVVHHLLQYPIDPLYVSTENMIQTSNGCVKRRKVTAKGICNRPVRNCRWRSRRDSVTKAHKQSPHGNTSRATPAGKNLRASIHEELEIRIHDLERRLHKFPTDLPAYIEQVVRDVVANALNKASMRSTSNLEYVNDDQTPGEPGGNSTTNVNDLLGLGLHDENMVNIESNEESSNVEPNYNGEGSPSCSRRNDMEQPSESGKEEFVVKSFPGVLNPGHPPTSREDCGSHTSHPTEAMTAGKDARLERREQHMREGVEVDGDGEREKHGPNGLCQPKLSTMLCNWKEVGIHSTLDHSFTQQSYDEENLDLLVSLVSNDILGVAHKDIGSFKAGQQNEVSSSTRNTLSGSNAALECFSSGLHIKRVEQGQTKRQI